MEDDETFTVGLAVSGTSHEVKTRFTATGTIRNDDTDPYLGADSPSVTEGDAGTTTLTFTARLTDANGRTQTSSRTITASYRVSSEDGATATAGRDYLETSGTLTFAPGETEKTIDVTVLGDTEDEDDETVTLRWTEWDGVLLVTYTRTGTILDDDQGASAADVTLSVDRSVVDESVGIITVTVTATLASAVSSATPVKVSLLTGGTATWGRDYAPVDDFTVTVPAKSTSGSGTFSLHPAPDPYVESDETIVVSGSAGGATVKETTITLTDFDGVRAANKWYYWEGIKLSAEPASIAEDGGIKLIKVTGETSAWGMPLFGDFSYEITIGRKGDSAVYGTDFLPGVRKFWINVYDRNRTGSTYFYIAPINDDEFEGDETITLHGRGPCAGGKSGPQCVAATTLTITDDDEESYTGPQVTLSATPVFVGEAEAPKRIKVSATSDSWSEHRNIRVALGIAGSTATMGTDYALVENFDIPLPKNTTHSYAYFTLTPIQDDLAEGDETITVTGQVDGTDIYPIDRGDGQTPVSGSPSRPIPTITLVDDEATPHKLSVSPSKVSENGGARTVTVTVTADTVAPYSRRHIVGVGNVNNDGATPGTDYAGVPAFDITIPANAKTASGSFTLTPVNDTLVENTESISIEGVQLSGGNNFLMQPVSMTLTDDETLPAVTLSTAPSSVSEGASPTSVTVTATAASAVAWARTVTASVGGSGTATSGTDYAAVSDFDITIAANATSGTGTFTLRPIQDSTNEGDETIGVSGQSPRTTVTGTTLTLADDDVHPPVSLSANPSSVSEAASATSVTVTATATSASTSARTVTVSVGGSGTATSGTDYAAVSDFTINIAANATTGTGTFTLTPTQDTDVEVGETIGVSGTSPGSRVTGASITLTDDDIYPAVTLSASPSSVSEGASATSVTVTATAASSVAVARTVTASVGSSGTATSGADYAQVTDFTITIAANATTGTGTFTLKPIRDTSVEGDETIGVAGASLATVVTDTTLTLTDDDLYPPVTLSVNPSRVDEDGGATQVTVTATAAVALTGSSAPTRTVTVSVGGSGTATSGTDYTAVTDFTITIAPNTTTGTATFTLTPTDDATREGDETIGVAGTSPSTTVTGTAVTLEDDELPTITLSHRPNSPIVEGYHQTYTITATRPAAETGSAVSVTVSVGTSNDTTIQHATPGTDYQAVSDFTINIGANATSGSGSFTVRTIDDSHYETSEWFTVSGTATGYHVTSTRRYITDNELPDYTLSVSPSTIAEGASATQVTVTATLGDPLGIPSTLEVWVGTNHGTATSGTDFTASRSYFQMSFGTHQTSGSDTLTLTPTQDNLIEGDETISVRGRVWGFNVHHTSLTLTDDDQPTIALSASPSTVSEGASATPVTVTATAVSTKATARTVTVSVGGSGTATSGTDYAAVSNFDISIPANATSGTGTFTLTPTHDIAVEGNETIGVSGTSANTNVAGTTVTLTDDENPAVTLTAAPLIVGEEAPATTVTVTATAASTMSSSRTVTVSVGGTGTATSGTDYAAVSDFTITIDANKTTGTGTFTLTPTQDYHNEGDETIGVAGTSTGAAVTGTTLTLTDDDLPTIILETVPADVKVAENVAQATVAVRATTAAPVKAETTVTLTIGASGDGATKTTDYTTPTIGTITIPQNRLGGESWFILAPVQDTNVESDESISVSGASSGGHAVTGTSLTLTDDDRHPAITLSANPSSVAEGASATSVTVTATAASAISSARTVTVSVGPRGSATSGTDYAAVSDFSVTIAANATSGTGTFTLTPTQDTNVEGSETIGVTGTSPLSQVTGTTLTLTDDDTYPAVTLSANPSSVGEAASGTSVTVTATAASAVSSARTVTVSVGASGTATAGVDYATVADFTVTIAANATSGTGTFTLTPRQDDAVEGSETIGVAGTSPHSTVTGTTVTLTDDDRYAIYLSVSPTTVAEDTDKQQVSVTATINLARTAATPLTVSVGDASDQAQSGTDYTAVADFTVTIPANKRSGTATFDFHPLTDKAYEGFESITISGTTSSGGGGASAQNASVNIPVQGTTLTLRDASSYPSLTLSVSPASVSESASATTVTAASSIAASREVTVSVGGSGTATSGTDYAAVSDFKFRIKPDSTKGSGTFTLTPTQDAIFEGSETIGVSGASLSTTVTGTTVTLTDDDNASVTVNDATAAEGSDITFTVTLDNAVQGGLTVTPDFTDVTAVEGTDYDENTSALTFTGTAGETRTFTVSTTQDAVVETNETFTVGLSVSNAPSGVTATDTGTGTIRDDAKGNADRATLTIGDASASEGDDITFTVTLDNAVQGGLTVTPSFTDGTAKSADYTANTKGISFTGTANESHTFTVATTEDAVLEANETFTVALAVSGTTLGNRINSTDTGTGTINDDDAATVTVNDGSVDEGGDITFTVTLDKAVQDGLTVTPGFTDGTAVEGTDYDENTAAISFTGTANETKTFTVSTTEDTVLEANETFTVGLTVSDAPSAVTATATGTGTINNDDAATITVNDASASEGSDITFTVTLDNAVQGGLTVTPSYSDGTTASGDYTANTTALTFTGTADETKTFTVATTDDAVLEADETFTVALSVSNAPSGVTSSDTGTGTVNNDDAAEVTIADVSAAEGDDMTFTVTLDNAVQGGLTVTPSYTNGTAANGDYTANTTGLSFSGTANETRTFTISTTEDAMLEADETITIGLSVSNAPAGVTSTDTGTGTINNDDAVTVTIDDASASEGESISFTITLDKAVQGGLTVTPGFTDGTATNGDYTANTAAISFSGTAGETETLTVATTEDAVLEGNETFTVALTVSDAPSGVTATDTGTGTVNNDDDASVTIDDASASEGGDITFTVTLDKAVQGGLTVTPGYTNGTTADGDYTANTTAISLTGTAGETKTFTVATTEDAVLEANETFTVGLTVANGPSGVTVTATDTGTGTINNDDASEVTIEDSSADEGDAMTLTVTLSEAVQGGLKVTPGFTDGTATEGTDYDENTAAVSFTGTKGETRSFTVQTTEDDVLEAAETFTVGLTVSDAPSGVTSTDTGTGTINNDDGAMVTVNDANAAEGGTITFTVSLGAAVQGGLTVTPDFTDGTATGGTDYTENTTALSFTGTKGEKKTFTIATTQEQVVEGDETFTVGLTVSGTSLEVTDTDTGTGTINNDDVTPAVNLSLAPSSVGEGADATTVTVTAAFSNSSVFAGDTTVTVSVGGDGTATSGTDYAAVTDFGITIKAGTGSATGTFTLTPTQDVSVEGNETITVSGSVTGLTVNGTTLTLNDDDGPPEVNLTATPSSVAEGATAMAVTVTAKFSNGNTFTQDTTVAVSVGGGGTATSGADYAAVADFGITIAAGGTIGAGTFTLTPTDDAFVEANETISVSGTAKGLTVNPATVTLTDDDAHAITLTAAPPSVEEGAAATTVTVTATAATAVVTNTTVTISVGAADDGATDGTDYASVADFNVVIPAGATAGTATFSLAPVDDTQVEGNESLSLSGSAARATVTGTDVTLVDNDTESSHIVLSAAPSSVGEDGPAATVTVTATASKATASARTVAVTVGASDDSATEGVDYADVADFTVTIPANATGGTATFTLDPVNDSDAEGNESLSVSGSAARATVTGTAIAITEKSQQVVVVLTAAPSSVKEGDTETVAVTATLQNGVVLSGALTVTVSVGGGTATAGTDYAAVADFAVVIPAETPSGSTAFTLATFNDDAEEGDETIAVTGASPGIEVRPTEVTIADKKAGSGKPVARDDEIIVDEGGTTSTLASGATSVLANDTDSDTPTSGLTVSLSTGPAWGVLVLNADGTFTYTHDGSENHADAFDYTVSDGKSTSAAATVRITVIPVNDAPVPHTDTIQVDEGGTATTLTSGAASVLANDPDPDAVAGQLSAALEGDVEHGTLALNADGTFVYTHDGSETTGDGFTYTVSDGEATRGPVSVVVVVGPMNDRPVARDDTVTVVVGAVATTVSNWANSYEERQSSVLANDSDVETPTDELTAEVVLAPDQSLPPDGFRLREDGTFYYVYRLSSVRTDRFTYTASDGEAKSDPATVFIRILANDPPHFDGDYEFELAENRDGSRKPVDVGRVKATDPNVAQAADAVTYAIVDGSVDLFTIDAESGEIVYTGPGEDAETPTPSHSLIVRATDTGGLSGDAKVLVRIANENETPTGSAIPKQTVAVGATVAVGLADYFSDPEDDPLSYTVSTENPESAAIVSLAIDGDTVRVTSVGDGPARARVEVEARDPGGLTAEQSFDVEVVRSKKEREQVLKLSLAGIGRTVATQAVDAVGARFDAASRLSRASTSQGPFDINPRAVGGILEAGGLVDAHTLRAHGLGADTLGGLPALGAPATGRVLAFALDADSTGTGNWTLWTSGATTDFRGRPSEFSIDGRMGAAFVGVDRRLGSNGVLGVVVSRNQGGVDFETPTNWKGDVDARLTTVYPYARWSPTARTDLWGMVGLGRGNVDMDDGQGTFDTEGRLRMGALGMRGDLARLGAVDLAVRADAFTVGMEADEVEGRVGAVEGRAQRARLMLDGSTDWALSSSSRLTPSVEVGARIDGGDVETGPGMELGGGLAYVNSRLGLDIAARGRWLAVHRDEHFGEWGGNLSIKRIPSDPDRGLSFSVQPTWGQDASGVAALWEGRQPRPGAFGHGLDPEMAAEAWRPDRMDMEISYGATLLDGRAALKPFGQLRAMGAGSRHLRVGTRLALGDPTNAASPMRLELLAEQRAQADGAASYGAGLNLAGADIGLGSGALAPFGEVTFDGASGRRMRLGTTLKLGANGGNPLPGAFRIEVAAEAVTRAAQASSYGLALRGSASR